MGNKKDIITETTKAAWNGYALAQAMLEDYERVVAKIENTSEDEINKRIVTRANEIIQEMKNDFPKPV